MNLAWWLERSTWEHPDKDAVIDAGGRRTTYAELRAHSKRIGNVLREQGIGTEDVVVSVMPDDATHVATFYGVIALGAAFSGLNYRASDEKVVSDVARCEARIAIVAPEYLRFADLLATLPTIERVIVTEPGDHRYPVLSELTRDASDELRIVDRASTDIAAINFTSGTSGASKGVTFTHGTLGNSAWGAIFLGGITSDSRNLSLVGMYHSGGIHDSVRMVMAGGTILWSGGWDVERVVRIFEEHRPNWMYWIIPTMMRDLMRHPRWPDLDLTGLRTYVAGEPVPNDVRDALLSKGAQVGNMYGLTEAMPVCVLGPSLYYREETSVPVGSSGRPVRGFSDVLLKDPVTGETLLGDDVEGEVCIKGDVVTPGYYRDPERTADAIDDEGYLHTRDRAYRDPDGWYWVRGRTDDIINPGGEKLSLIEVDSTLLEHPLVVDAACIGVAHDRFGEVPAAFVQLTEELDRGEARDLLDAYMSEALERWKRPRLYIFVDAVPRTPAKRSKMHGAMRDRVAGIVLRDAEGVVTIDEVRQTGGAE
jgi:acyl-coenzyme A synthetase/AMP-(fatty) acid ligase